MCQYSATDGLVNDWHIVHYGTRAVGGVGLLMLEATAVAPEGRITPFDLGLWDDNQIAGLEKITRFAHEQGATTAIQIAHAGRKASHNSPANGGKQLPKAEGGWQTVAPSAIPFDSTEIPPHELNETEIEHIAHQFTATARRAKQAAFDVLEIHAAHGYLIHQFLSPLSNKRIDEYGGSFENHIRLLLKIVTAVKTVWPQELPLFVRLSATDWTEGGWSLEETVKLSEILHRQGVDLIDCSSGGNVSTAKIPLSPGYQVHFSEEIKKMGVLTAAVGLITNVEQMNSILADKKADMIFLGRELLRNPYFPIVSTLRSDGEIEWPIQYLRGK